MTDFNRTVRIRELKEKARKGEFNAQIELAYEMEKGNYLCELAE